MASLINRLPPASNRARFLYKSLCSRPLITLPNSQASQTLPALSTHRFNSTSSKNTMADNFLSTIKARRTYYQLEGKSPISDERIQEIVNQTFLHTPSSFNSQTSRALVLVGNEHKHLWDQIVKPAVKAVAPASAWPNPRRSSLALKQATAP
jgi:Nitroreductase family